MRSSSESEIGISRKTFQEGKLVVVELGLNLQNDQDPPFFKSKSSSALDHHHDHHHHHDHDHHYHVDDGNGSSSSVKGGPTCNVYPTMMKSDTSIYDATIVDANSYPFFKPSGAGGMATSAMGFPFTAAQWKELERQAMVYKYMVASLPVPPDLLYSSFPTTLAPPSTFSPTSYFVGKYGNGLNLRWVGNSKDAEPGRCRRTDGKKWRCSRDVAPNQKYCERHMHRGRPRSRKPVELIKNSNPNTKKTRLNDSNAQPVVSSLPSVSLSKGSTFDHHIVSPAIPFEDSRSLAWAEEQQQWQQLVQQKHLNPSVFQQQFDGVPVNLNSNYSYNPKSEIGLLERPLIDAWSMGLAEHKDNYGNHKAPFSSNNDHGNAFDENMCQIHMGLGVIDSSWVGSSPISSGGPLAEVLRPGSVAPAGLGSNPASSDVGEVDFLTPPATAVSSPSGVLQKPHGAFSDSSGNSTPTYHNSKAKSDMPFHWLS